MAKYDGGPAYPFKEEDGQGGFQQFPGMSLRDYFAGKALSGIVANPPQEWEGDFAADCARIAYEWADAMLVARAAQSAAKPEKEGN